MSQFVRDTGFWIPDADRMEGERGRPGEREKENQDTGCWMPDTGGLDA